jgi:hypothetical protein
MLHPDLLLALLAASVLLVAYLADPHHVAHHNITQTMDERSACIIILLIQSTNVILMAAVAFACRGHFVAWVRGLIKKPKPAVRARSRGR